jgi:DNA-binding IclR family transcriptional regulator
MTERNPPEERVFAVERALMLLQCFGSAGETRTLASLARQSGLYKSTILRIANSMCKMGFLIRDDSGLFALGPEIGRLGSLSRMSVDVEAIMRPALRALTAATRETASFYVRDGRYRMCLFRENSPRAVRHHLDEGRRRPLTSGAAGQVLRAYSKHAKDPELAFVRRHGWAISKGERNPDLAAIAAPIFNREKELLGALAISGLLTRFTADKEHYLRERLIGTAQGLVARMRFVHPQDLIASAG